MSWSRIKTILIILFLLTDIFLAASILTAEKKENEISPEVLDASIQILKEHNIILNKSAELPKMFSVPVLQADNAINDYDAFAALVLGDDLYMTAPNVYSSDKGELSFWGDRFSFKSKQKGGSADSITQKAAQKILFSFLKSIKFNTSNAKIISASEDGGIWTFKVRDFAEKLPVFSSELDAAVSKDGVISLSGSWFNLRDTREQNSGVKGVTGLLIDFAGEYSRPAEIMTIEFGYSVFDNENYHKSASLIPVDKIVLGDKTEYFMDARSE